MIVMIAHIILLLSVCQFTIQMEGVIVSLPTKTTSPQPTKASKVKAAVNKAVGPEIHTWKNKMAGYQLECRVSVTSPGRYSVRVLYSGALLEAMEVTRFDGELTKSITIQSTNTTVHIVRYLMTDRTGVTRYYKATSDGKGFEFTEEDCEFPASLWEIHKTKFRGNGWIWGSTKWENWDKTKPGLWKGAIAVLPNIETAPDPGLTSSLKLHSWTNVVPGYSMTVYRITKDSQTFHYIAIYYHMELLQSGVQITKFDDTLLNSVSVSQPSGPIKDHYEIQYKFHEGSCKERLYTHILEKATSSKLKLEVSESPCEKFTAYKFWTYVTNLDAINGWLY